MAKASAVAQQYITITKLPGHTREALDLYISDFLAFAMGWADFVTGSSKYPESTYTHKEAYRYFQALYGLQWAYATGRLNAMWSLYLRGLTRKGLLTFIDELAEHCSNMGEVPYYINAHIGQIHQDGATFTRVIPKAKA